MSAELLKKTMKVTKKKPKNVASDTGLGVNTVNRYLNGETVNESTEKLLKLWVDQHSKELNGLEAAG